MIGLGAAKAAGKLPGQFTKIMDTVANDAQRLHQAGKNITQKSVRALEEAIDPVVQGVRQKFGHRWADATAYGGEINAGSHGVEDVSKGALTLERSQRQYISKLDGRRLEPIQAAREHAHRHGQRLDEKEWKNLSPKQKSERLTKECGYDEIIEYDKPVNRQAVDSELDRIKNANVEPLEPEKAQEIVDRLRQAFQLDDRNVAIAQTHIDGVTDSMAAISGLSSPDGTIARPLNPLFKIIGKLDGAIDHANDSEIKILEQLARQLKETSEGVINLYSERPPCQSCEKVIEQFEKMFPKVKVNTTSE
jgi:hypothetical protein